MGVGSSHSSSCTIGCRCSGASSDFSSQLDWTLWQWGVTEADRVGFLWASNGIVDGQRPRRGPGPWSKFGDMLWVMVLTIRGSLKSFR